MVKPRDLIDARYPDPIDRAILYELYLLRRSYTVSAREMTKMLLGRVAVLEGKHKKNDSAERTIRNHLSNLESRGSILKTLRDPTGKRGRIPEVFRLSDQFQMEIESFLRTKDIQYGLVARIFLETDASSSLHDSGNLDIYNGQHLFGAWQYFTYLDTINLRNTIKPDGQDHITLRLIRDFQHPPFKG